MANIIDRLKCPEFPTENFDYKTCFFIALFVSDFYEPCVSSDSAVDSLPEIRLFESSIVDIEKLPFLPMGDGVGR